MNGQRFISRRAALRAGALGLGAASLSALLAACGDAVESESAERITQRESRPNVRRLVGSAFNLVTSPATSVAGAAGAINLPPELIAARGAQLLELSERGREMGEAWRRSGWGTNFELTLVRFEEILSGGVVRDGIPPIDRPVFTDLADADGWLAGREPVIALNVNGDARAYPLQIMIYHEIANDVVGDLPVVTTFCPLCNSSLAFEREVFGAVLRFGVSGNLRNSDLIMWDSLTETWWQQLTGEAIVGDLAGARLRVLPSQLISYDEFKAAFPQGRVLSRDTGASRPYGKNPYQGYDDLNQRPFLFRGVVDVRAQPMERVVALSIGAEDVAYSFSLLRMARVVNDTVGGEPVVVFWTPETASALDGPTIADSAAVGSGVAHRRVVDGRELTFEFVDGEFRDLETGSTWTVMGRSIAGELKGASLPPVVYANHFWFAWAAFKPNTRLKLRA